MERLEPCLVLLPERHTLYKSKYNTILSCFSCYLGVSSSNELVVSAWSSK